MCLYKKHWENNEKEEIVNQLGLWLVNVFCILHFIPLIYPIFSAVRIQFGSGSTALAKKQGWIRTCMTWTPCRCQPCRPCGPPHSPYQTLSRYKHCFKIASQIPLKFREGTEVTRIFASAILWSIGKLLECSQRFGMSNCTVCTHYNKEQGGFI